MTDMSLFLRFVLVVQAAAVLLLAHYGFGWLAALIVLGQPVYNWIRGERSWSSFVDISPQILFGLSIVALISISRPPIGQPVFPVVTQVGLAILYGVWQLMLPRFKNSPNLMMMIVGLNQLMATGVIFLGAAYWHWPNVIVVVATWVVSLLNAWWILQQRGERAAQILAASWALIAAEIAWVLQSWQVNYIIGDGLIIIPQASIITLGVGYCFLSIYSAHSAKKLSRRRLVEYVAIAGVLMAIVIAGTRWNGTT